MMCLGPKDFWIWDRERIGCWGSTGQRGESGERREGRSSGFEVGVGFMERWRCKGVEDLGGLVV